jgi:lipopolysaccharide export system protein LptA
MLKAFFTVRNVLIVLLFLTLFYLSVTPISAENAKPIVITSQTLIVDNKSNTATFEGSVVAKTEDIIIYSDKMEVSYNNSQGEITKIHAYGNVRVHKKERVIFSKEAIYLGQEEKIIFTGNPKAVDGENVITGTQIIYFFKDDRAIVKNSNVVLKKKQE